MKQLILALSSFAVIVVLFKFLPFFVEPIPRNTSCRVKPNLLFAQIGACLNSNSDSQLSFDSLNANILIDGSVLAMLVVDSFKASIGNEKNVVRLSLPDESRISCHFDSVATTKIVQADSQLCRIMLQLADKPESKMFVKYSNNVDKTVKESAATHTTAMGDAIKMNFEYGSSFTMKFLDQSVLSMRRESLPREFIINTPTAFEWGYRGQRLALEKAQTFTVSLGPDSPRSPSGDMMISADTISAHIVGGSVTVGSTTYQGEQVLYCEGFKEPGAFWFESSDDPTMIDAAITLTPQDSLQSWMGFRGGVNQINFSAIDGFIGFGNNSIELDNSATIRLEGAFIVGLDFEGGDMPIMGIDGFAHSIKINEEEQLKTGWQNLDPEIRGGAIGGYFGFMLSFAVSFRRKKTS